MLIGRTVRRNARPVHRPADNVVANDDQGAMMSDTNVPMFQSLAMGLHEYGVDTLFGLMGDANLFLVDCFVKKVDGRFIPAVHEGSAIMMAQGYARVTGRVGVATVTHGPALTNCVTALTDAARAHTPMVLLAGDTPVTNPDHLQSTDQRQVARLCGIGFEQLRAPATATHDLARAFYRAQAERRPILLNMPADFMWEQVTHQPAQQPYFDTPAFAPQGPVLDEAIGMIASARRPLILAGGGAIDVREALVHLADRLEAPLATTLKAKGLFDGHDYAIDICGTLSTPGGYDAIAKADCVVCFGAGLNVYTTDHGKLFKGKRIVQVDNDSRAVGRSLHPDAALIADAELTARNFVHWLDEAEIPASGFTRELDPATLRLHEPSKPGERLGDVVNYVEAIEWLEQHLPRDKVLVTDGGRFMTEVWCRVSASDPCSFVDTVNFGSIGLGLQAAIGAGIGAPDRPVVLFSGDGGFMMGGMNEFNTAVRLGLDLIVVVCNDGAYGAEHIQFRDRQMQPDLSTFQWPSFGAVAESLGGQGLEIRSDADFDGLAKALTERNGPMLIDLRLDPNDVPRMRV